MKKLVSLLLVVCMCLSISVMLTACGHEHTYQTEWSKDAMHHWHACEGEDCTEVSDKAEHTWNEGEITTEATAEADGVKTFTCTVCGQTKTQNVPFSTAVTNTTVTEEEWIAALSESAFTINGYLNVTVKYKDVQGEEFCYLADGKHIEIVNSAVDGKEMLWVTEDFDFDDLCRKDCGNVFEMVDKYALFRYDEENESYILYDANVDDEKYELVFLDKKLVSCTITIGVDTEYEESWTHTYLNVGTTTMPDGEIAN